MICALREMAIALGRTPTRDEFVKSLRGGRRLVDTLFNDFTAVVIAAGLEPSPHATKRKWTNQIFEKNIETVLKDYQPRPEQQKIIYSPTLAIPDTHFPFISQRVLDAIYRFAEKEKPTRIIQLGDLYDMYSHSKFPRSHNLYMPKQEEELGRAMAIEMWKILRGIVPNAELVQIKGNHDMRPLKQTLSMMPSIEHVIERYINELMTFEGVKLIEDPRQEYYFDDVQVIHGYFSGQGKHRDFAMMNTIFGHQHVGGVVFRRLRGQTLWELNAGLVGDPESKALAYTGQKTFSATPGFGFLDEYGPRFIAA